MAFSNQHFLHADDNRSHFPRSAAFAALPAVPIAVSIFGFQQSREDTDVVPIRWTTAVGNFGGPAIFARLPHGALTMEL